MYRNRTFPQKIYDILRWIKPEVLNDSAPEVDVAISDEPLVVRLKKCVNLMKAEAIDLEKGRIDYGRLAGSETYAIYRALTVRLQKFDLSELSSRQEKLAFWINIYNALIIDGIIRYGAKKSVNKIPGFFERVAYNIGGYRFSTDDIEHGILRSNAGHLVIPGSQFGENDPRRSFMMDTLDFRIHFAVVCGARSCPPINFYDVEKIDEQLDLAARSFLNSDGAEIDIARKRMTLSKILQWYGADFGAGSLILLGFGDKTPILQTIAPYIVDEEKRTFIHQHAGELKVRFRGYDWSLNQI